MVEALQFMVKALQFMGKYDGGLSLSAPRYWRLAPCMHVVLDWSKLSWMRLVDSARGSTSGGANPPASNLCSSTSMLRTADLACSSVCKASGESPPSSVKKVLK